MRISRIFLADGFGRLVTILAVATGSAPPWRAKSPPPDQPATDMIDQSCSRAYTGATLVFACNPWRTSMRMIRLLLLGLLALTLAAPAAAQWPRSVFVELGSATW